MAFHTDRLEPDCSRVDTSSAVSLKRIADALDALASLYAAGPALKATGATYQGPQDPPPTFDPGRFYPLTPKAEPDADGWVEWTGGTEIPVTPETLIDIKDRDGHFWPGVHATDADLVACPDFWNHERAGVRSNDIIAYRIAK